jgi:hypothetical protein
MLTCTISSPATGRSKPLRWMTEMASAMPAAWLPCVPTLLEGETILSETSLKCTGIWRAADAVSWMVAQA